MNKPAAPIKIDFLIVGAAKCATTSFHHYLNQHPDIYLPLNCGINHETGYFLKPGPEHIKGLTNDMIRKDVDRLFDHYGNERLVGERSTDYTKAPFRTVHFEKIRSHNPNMRFLYLVRDPVTNVKKLYFHHLTHQPEQTDRNFAGELESTPGYYERICSHYFQAEMYLWRFDPKHFLVINIDHLEQRSRRLLRSVFHFLGVDDSPVNVDRKHNINIESRRLSEIQIRVPASIEDRLRADHAKLIAHAERSGNYVA